MEDRIWVLFAHRVSGELTDPEKLEFEELMRYLPNEGQDMKMILSILDAYIRKEQESAAGTAESHWPRLEAAIRKLGKDNRE